VRTERTRQRGSGQTAVFDLPEAGELDLDEAGELGQEQNADGWGHLEEDLESNERVVKLTEDAYGAQVDEIAAQFAVAKQLRRMGSTYGRSWMNCKLSLTACSRFKLIVT